MAGAGPGLSLRTVRSWPDSGRGGSLKRTPRGRYSSHFSSKEIKMVQLFPSTNLDVSPLSEGSYETMENGLVLVDSPKVGSSETIIQPLHLETSTIYHGYDAYIENGLICLKHKVRNLEKKKLKLEGYKNRLRRGETLNPDQMVAVEKYEEVLHHLQFAQELCKTLDGLTMNLLRAQKKAAKKEQLAKVELERKHLSLVLQVQHLLQGLRQEHVKRDLLAGKNQAPQLSAEKLHNLNQLANLLGVERDPRLSLKEQMEEAALAYSDLLEGKDKPVVGSTFKCLKEELMGLLNFKYFNCLSPPFTKYLDLLSSTCHRKQPSAWPTVTYRCQQTERKVSPTKNWTLNVLETTEQEPPDCWDMKLSNGSTSHNATSSVRLWFHPPAVDLRAWFLATLPAGSLNLTGELVQPEPLRARGEEEDEGKRQELKALQLAAPMVFNSTTALPKDPILRKQQLEDLMTDIHGAFSFMQDSLLDSELSSSKGHPELRKPPFVSPAVLDSKTYSDAIPKLAHSTPLSSRIVDFESIIHSRNGDQCRQTCDLELASKSLHKKLQLVERKQAPSPPLYDKEEIIFVSLEDKSCALTPVTPLEEHPPCRRDSCPPPQERVYAAPASPSMASVHLQNTKGNENRNKRDSVASSEPKNAVGTQTPPEFAQSGYESHYGYSDCTFSSDGQTVLSLGQSEGHGSQSGQPCGRGSLRATLSDLSPVNSPDREEAFTVVDSGHEESLAFSTSEVPLTPHNHQHTALLPLHFYPLSQSVRVAFTASRTANFAPSNLDQPIVFDQLHSNLGDMYDSHIGRFTAPVNGTYVFIFNILKLAINVPLYINLMRNEEVIVSAYANDGAPDHETASNHAILPLFQGDQMWLRLHRGAIYGSTWKYSTFSGFLLYQD
ncbi:Caprin-2 RNA granule protein 140 [Takifugu flavidus]|uniref:Caprin-2 RNA granule protein 140 n=1 Tax=Takifugu flavidus TaxID=433684 RepID=A0A5C6NDZ1_9TELE|nr:Caprin-2 RNA granule protein 140 [Takifugu flavidus]